MIKSKGSINIIIVIFLFYSLGSVLLHLLFPNKDSNLYNYFTDSYGIIAGIGGYLGYRIADKWGGLNSKVGRAVIAFSLGLVFQFLGQLSYSYYRYVSGIEVPYPSFGDLFYLLSIPTYIYASWLIIVMSGAKVKFMEVKYKFLSLIVVAISLTIAYYLILSSHDFSNSDLILVALELGYPVGQAIFLSFSLIALILSRSILGGLMKPVINSVLFALVFQYIADMYFTYEVLNESLYAGGLSDYIYIVAYTLMAVAIYEFGEVPARVGTNKQLKG